MQLIDATIAFALTLAAFGTVVTVIMETVHRVLRVRKGNLILVLQRLNKEIPKGLFKEIDPRHRWDFIANVLNNTTRTKDMLPDSTTLGAPNGAKSIPTVFWLPNTKVPAISDQKPEQAWEKAIDSLGRRNGTRGIYDKVSCEYVLRQLVEISDVREKVAEAREAAKVEINRLAKKYEEFACAASADFKRRAQLWSFVIGILLALVANINGIRLFEAYLARHDLTARVIGQFETLEKEAKKAQDSFKKVIEEKDNKGDENLHSQIEAKRKTLTSLYQSRALADAERMDAEHAKLDENIKALEKEIDELVEKRYAASEAGKAQQAAGEAAQKLKSLAESGIPIGNKYFPHCLFYKWMGNEKEGACLEGEEKSNSSMIELFLRTISWIVVTVLTGMLIGLGAPFWFDVAKRLAAVRAMFGGTQSTEERLSGRDSEGDPEKRKELVENIVDDAISEYQVEHGLGS